jgi:hypothetical protein
MKQTLVYNEEVARKLARQMESMFMEDKPTYAEVLVACTAMAAIAANQMHMSKEVYLANCELVYETDKLSKIKEMQ